MMALFSFLFIGIILGSFFLVGVLFLFHRFSILDFPEKYGLTRKRLPYPVGISMVFAFFTGVFLMMDIDMKMLVFILTGLILAGLCFWDDRKGLPAIFRLGVQTLLAIALVISGISIAYVTNPFGRDTLALGSIIGGVLTVIWILGMVNASNWLDGIPNLSLGSSVLAALVLGILSISDRVDQMELGAMIFLFLGTVLPVIFLNVGKERGVVGDSGSMLAGFCIAVFSLFSGGKLATAIIVMLIPLLDAFYVICYRLIQGSSPFRGNDKRHFHDFLLYTLHWSHWKILLLFWSVSGVLGVSALFLDTLGKILLILTISVIFLSTRFYFDFYRHKNFKNTIEKK